MTDGQRRALTEQWPAYGLDVEDGVIGPQIIFENHHETVVEIGFGMGDSLIEMASTNADINFIGVEVHRPGVGHLLIKASELGLRNLRVFNADSVEVIDRCIGELSIDRIQVFFPDPWHKKKHHKRRLINAEFAEKLVARLKRKGVLHIATDWENYAESIVDEMSGLKGVERISAPERPVTKYERRGLKLDHSVFDLAWRKM
jgi:tRNA (guanine-N7-)-methyltransferase